MNLRSKIHILTYINPASSSIQYSLVTNNTAFTKMKFLCRSDFCTKVNYYILPHINKPYITIKEIANMM